MNPPGPDFLMIAWKALPQSGSFHTSLDVMQASRGMRNIRSSFESDEVAKAPCPPVPPPRVVGAMEIEGLMYDVGNVVLSQFRRLVYWAVVVLPSLSRTEIDGDDSDKSVVAH